MSNVVPLPMTIAMLGAYGESMTNPKVGLYVNNVTPNQNTQWGDLVEASYTGYSRATATFGEVFLNDDGSVSTVCESVQFQGPSSGASQTAYGSMVFDGSSVIEVYSINPLPTPVVLADNLDAVIVSPSITLGPIVS